MHFGGSSSRLTNGSQSRMEVTGSENTDAPLYCLCGCGALPFWPHRFAERALGRRPKCPSTGDGDYSRTRIATLVYADLKRQFHDQM